MTAAGKAPKRLVGALAAVAVVAAGVWAITVQPMGAAGEAKGTVQASPDQLRRDVEQLVLSFAGRSHAHPGTLFRAAGYIERRFRTSGARVEVDAYEVEGAAYRNVIARFGPAEGRPIVIGAHYDAQEETPGADDNASGVAGLLALADRFQKSPPAVPVELVAYCLEEPPYFRTEHMGSRRHARSLKAAGREPRLVMVLEMIGYFADAPGSQRYPVPGLSAIYPDQGNFIGVVGNYASMEAVREVKAAMRQAGTVLVEAIVAPAILPGIDFSDHASYWQEGMPAVMVTDTAFYRNPNYHRSSDLPGTLDYARMAGVVGAVARVVEDVQAQLPH